MSDTRSLEILYEILWEEIKDLEEIASICDKIKLLHISDNLITKCEELLLREHFHTQIKLHPEFMTNERNWNFPTQSWHIWWTMEETDNPINRKAFIQEIISTL